jgi:hypothetical protein
LGWRRRRRSGIKEMTNEKITRQQETIDKVVKWLKEERFEITETTHMHLDANYFAVASIAGKGFNVIFPAEYLDVVLIVQLISLDKDSQKAYERLEPLKQNTFYFDLKLALYQMHVDSDIKDNMRKVKSLEVRKAIFFDGLTKDRLFEVIDTVDHSINIAKIKLGQFRDSIMPFKAGDIS